MRERTYSDAERGEALELAARIGINPAARVLGIPKSTVAGWANGKPVRGGMNGSTHMRVVRAYVLKGRRAVQLECTVCGALRWVMDGTPVARCGDCGRKVLG